MKSVLVLVSGLCACQSQRPPELRCKDAVEKAATAAHLDGRDVTLAIGECEQHDWKVEARECIAAVHTKADVVSCSSTFGLGKQGIFAESMSPEKVIAQMTHFRDEMCACHDAKCAQAVSDEMTKWGQDERRSGREPPKLSDDDVKVFTKMGEDMGHCMQKAFGGGTP